jgi:hypothetical protein
MLLCVMIAGLLAQAADPQAPTAHVVNARGAPSSALTNGASDLTYHNGTVQHDQKVFTVFWNPTSTPFPAGYEATINQFIADLDNSDYYGIASQYADGNGNVSRQISFGGTWTDTTTPFPETNLTWQDLRNEVNLALAATGWPLDSNSYVQIFTGTGVGSAQGANLCGVHWTAPVPMGQIMFPRAGCQPSGPTPNELFADSAINISAHEILETLTDPSDGGWYRHDTTGEIADLCAWTFGSRGADGGNVALNGHRYLVQMAWSNASSSCTLAYDVTASVPVIIRDPSSQTVTVNYPVVLNAAAAGLPSPKVQWQASSDRGATFNDVPGWTSSDIQFNAAESDAGRMFRAVYTNASGVATTSVATITVTWGPWMQSQPSSTSVTAGSAVSFIAQASASPAATVQWQVAAKGSTTFSDIAGATSPTYSFVAASADDGKQFRAVFTNPYGTATSAAAALRVMTQTAAPSITTQPVNARVTVGQTASFSAAASGTPTPAVQWQVAAPGASAFADIGGATSTTLAFTTGPADDGKRFRAVFTNSAGSATTAEAVLAVTATTTAPTLTAEPQNATVAAGDAVTFTATASGSPVPTVQWQTSLDRGATWSNVAGATVGVYSFVVATSDNGRTFRAVFTNAAGTAVSLAAQLTVRLPSMSVAPAALSFTATSTGSAFAAQTGAQLVRLVQQGGGSVMWTATSTAPWLVVSPTSGSGTSVLTVSVQFVPGVVSSAGSIAISVTGASNTVSPIAVSLRVVPVGTTTAPFGSLDTPQDRATGVAGSIAVTGWALSDMQVTRVTVCRDGVGGETAPHDPNCGGNPNVYVGDAVFVDGARPDVQAGNSALPFSSRAGWGYLLLTNFLPGLGNGTFTLRAYAFDTVGHVTALGSKTITCDNAHSAAPFGAIDTPGQGDVISGVVANFGWVLSPGTAKADPPDGGAVSVLVDGLNVGSPGGWSARSDLSALFPQSQFSGIGHALGVFGLNTTLFTNGVHTIAWIVTDTGGHTSGVGSRFFTVSNGALTLDPTPAQAQQAANAVSASTALDLPPAAAARTPSPRSLVAELDRAPEDVSSVPGRRGFDLERPLQTYPNVDGRIEVQAEELDRVELHLSPSSGQVYTGYLLTRAGIAPLPIGSTLDASTGVFDWMPGVGFVGDYDLVFVRWSGDLAVARQDVRITLNPRGSTRVGPQTTIDAPGEGRVLGAGQPFFIGGWAADLDSSVDSGVNTVHVWAYPVDADGTRLDPAFLGPAIYGGARPDVAAVYGDRFADSGYGIIVNGLGPGTYDIAVFAYSTEVKNFTPAKVVRVTVR